MVKKNIGPLIVSRSLSFAISLTTTLTLTLVLATGLSACKQKDRQNESYTDLGSDVTLTETKHRDGWGRSDCTMCHNVNLNVHRNPGSPVYLKRAEELPACTSCHGSNGVVSSLLLSLFVSQAKAETIKERPKPARSNECQLCHMNRTESHSKLPLKRQHKEIGTKHGQKELSCHECHDVQNHDFLKTSESFPASFEDTSPLCSRCHPHIYKDWQNGVHGKRSGGWEKDKQVRFNCIDCHKPHSVHIESMKAEPAPVRPKIEPGLKKDE